MVSPNRGKMRNDPILFNCEMVNAARAGDKTQTRRVITFRNSYVDGSPAPKKYWNTLELSRGRIDPGPSPAGNPGPYLKAPRPWIENGKKVDESVHRIYPRWWKGDRLWVKETFAFAQKYEGNKNIVLYRADGEVTITAGAFNGPAVVNMCWRPSIFMPRWASRLLLEIEDIKPEPIQAISPADILREGITHHDIGSTPTRATRYSPPEVLREAFMNLWDGINAKRGFDWKSNPWVWAITFRVIKGKRNAAD